MHETEGSYSGAVSWFSQTRSEVSAHLVLREDGQEATQCVPWTLPAWHAVNANAYTIGIELAGFTAKPNNPRQIAIAARIVGYLGHKFGIPMKQSDAYGRNGICRHKDLGLYGGGHSDPGGFDWEAFLASCKSEYNWGHYRTEPWGRFT